MIIKCLAMAVGVMIALPTHSSRVLSINGSRPTPTTERTMRIGERHAHVVITGTIVHGDGQAINLSNGTSLVPVDVSVDLTLIGKVSSNKFTITLPVITLGLEEDCKPNNGTGVMYAGQIEHINRQLGRGEIQRDEYHLQLDTILTKAVCSDEFKDSDFLIASIWPAVGYEGYRRAKVIINKESRYLVFFLRDLEYSGTLASSPPIDIYPLSNPTVKKYVEAKLKEKEAKQGVTTKVPATEPPDKVITPGAHHD